MKIFSTAMTVFSLRLRLWSDRREGGTMRAAAIVTMGVLAAVMAQAGESEKAAERRVTVCLEGGAGSGVKIHAQHMASTMFAGIGVTVNWHEGARDCPTESIVISLTNDTPTGLFAGALGYALPYEGAHIRLFYDRIVLDRHPVLVPALLAHVMVHEITHILQGINEHAAEGVMKAQWTADDFAGMIQKPLPFTDGDIDLIYRGLATRTAHFHADAELNAQNENLRNE